MPDHHPPETVTYDCRGGQRHVRNRTDAAGRVRFRPPHSRYRIGPIRHRGYFPSNFRDPAFRAIAGKLRKVSTTKDGRHIEYRLLSRAGLKVPAAADAEGLALENPLVRKCLARHPELAYEVKKPSLTWRVRFLFPGSDRLKLVTTINSISGDVGVLGCWDPCCARRRPTRFERRLQECPKLRSQRPGTLTRKRWACDTIDADFKRLQDYYRRNPNPAEQERYERLYREYKAAKP